MKIRILGVALLATFNARADLDSESQRLLIEKLDRIYLDLSGEDPAKVGVTLRLADLYADRARVCVDCIGDRGKALRLYEEVVERAPARGKVLVQIGHLQQLNGENEKAAATYRRILREDVDALTRAEAHLSLAEIAFKSRDYRAAIPEYEAVLEIPTANSRGLAAYRRAWSHFHLGQTELATRELVEILKDPKLLARFGAQADPRFQEEVSRDYATFLAVGPVDATAVSSLFELSPENTRLANVQALAAEAERLGKKDQALQAQTFVVGKLRDPRERLNARLAIAQLRLDRGEKAEAVREYAGALQAGASDQEVRRRARGFIVALKNDPESLPAFDAYLEKYAEDVDVHVAAAQVARERKDWARAFAYLEAARARTTDAGKLESILLTELEVGESSGDPTMAFGIYAQHSVQKTKLAEVRYAQARWPYERGDFARASAGLRAFALDPAMPRPLRKTAADLSLDALVLAKSETSIAAWAREFAAALPEARADFQRVEQKAALTKSAALAETDPASGLAALDDVDFSAAAPEDRTKYLRNRLVLATKLGRAEVATAAADGLLALPELPPEDRELAWSRKAHFAELKLDFVTAFTATSKLQKISSEEKNLKLALFAELSGQPSAPFYQKLLLDTRDAEKKSLVAAEIARQSPRMDQALERLRAALKASPELLADLYLEAYVRAPSAALLKKVGDDPRLRHTPAGRRLARESFLLDYAKERTRLAADRLNGKRMAASLKRRADLLRKADALAREAISNKDWSAQVLSLDLVARENERFYQDLMSAPVPTGLNAEEEREYLSLLTKRAAPYQSQAVAARLKVEEFWSADWATSLEQAGPGRKLARREIEALAEIAPTNARPKLAALLAPPVAVARPSGQELESARRKVAESPLDQSALAELLALEKRGENAAMVSYLTSRLNHLQTKGTL